MKKIFKYLKIWWMLLTRTSQSAFSSRFGAVFFIFSKFLRFFFFLAFLVLVSSRTREIGGYSLWQIIFFYVTFNLVDSFAQFFLREVYRFRSYILTGNFDYILTKPFSSLFRSLFGGSDILDLPMILMSIFFIFYSASQIGTLTLQGTFFYFLLISNAFMIALSFHILILSIGVATTEIDNTILLYRDLSSMGRIPIDIYLEPIRSLLTFVIPVGIMVTFPAKALMGLLSPVNIMISFIIGISFLLISMKAWKYSLKYYSSASS